LLLVRLCYFIFSVTLILY